MEMSYLVWCLGIFDLVSKIIWITRVTDTNTAPKDGPSERPEGGNLGTTFKEKTKKKSLEGLSYSCPTYYPSASPLHGSHYWIAHWMPVVLQTAGRLNKDFHISMFPSQMKSN